jgi:hypothetical protein
LENLKNISEKEDKKAWREMQVMIKQNENGKCRRKKFSADL